jgi:hypothetical protein
MKDKYISDCCGVKDINDSEFYGAYKIFFGTLVSESRLKIINLLIAIFYFQATRFFFESKSRMIY